MYKNEFLGDFEELNNEIMNRGFTSMFEAQDFEWNRQQGSIAVLRDNEEYIIYFDEIENEDGIIIVDSYEIEKV